MNKFFDAVKHASNVGVILNKTGEDAGIVAVGQEGIFQAEKKDDPFVRLAEIRVNKTLKNIHMIGNLSNRNNYKYTPEQAERVIQALEDAVAEVRKAFDGKQIKQFKL